MVDVQVRAEWLHAGVVTRDTEGGLLVPRPRAEPGIYAFTFWAAQNLMELYVGESLDLDGRTGKYRSHTGTTNTRIRNRINEWLDEGPDYEVRLWCAYNADLVFQAGGPPTEAAADLQSKANRLVAESAAVAQAVVEYGDHIHVLNKAWQEEN